MGLVNPQTSRLPSCLSTFVLTLAASVVGCSMADEGPSSSASIAGASATAVSGSGGTSTLPNGGGSNTAGTASNVGGTGIGGSTGAAGIGASAGAATAGNSGMAGSSGIDTRTGTSSGCNVAPPAGDSSSKFVAHEVRITGLDPTYLTGGENFDSSGPYDFAFRPFSVRLPDGYDPSKPYAVTFGGGGCGSSAQNFAGNPGGGLQMAGNGKTIQIGLSYISGCFSDGGPSIDNRPDTPDEAYFRAVWADIENHYCIDKSQVFVGGFSSGAWEAYMLGCAASDVVRGIGTDKGGMRMMHPACTRPIAAVLVAGEVDTENPIGPLDPIADKGAVDRLGSLGSAPGRDEILKRNGCTGTDSVAYEDAKYGACKKYTGCPAAYPVVWCALPGVGHNSSTYMGTSYSPGPMWDVLGKLPKP
jgi:hypothetical protein